HTSCLSDWSSDVCSSDLAEGAEDAEGELMSLGEDALAGGGGGDRGIEQLGQGAELGLGAADTDAVAGDDDRAGGGGDQPQGGLRSEERRGGRGWRVWGGG